MLLCAEFDCCLRCVVLALFVLILLFACELWVCLRLVVGLLLVHGLLFNFACVVLFNALLCCVVCKLLLGILLIIYDFDTGVI